MRALRGVEAMPVVKFDSVPMKTKYAIQPRPEFTILEWAVFCDNTSSAHIEYQPLSAEPSKQEVKTAKRGLKKLDEPSLAESLDDKIPW
jgi:hypothetical protein